MISSVGEYLDNVKQAFITSHIVRTCRIKSEYVDQEEGYIRIRSRLRNGDLLEVFEFVVLHAGQIKLHTYRFHWQSRQGALIKRWDNAPHYPKVNGFPHHVHILSGQRELAAPSQALNANEVLKLIALEIE